MTRTDSWSLTGAEGQAILGDTHAPAGDAEGTLVLCHGFKGYKDYGFFPQLAEAAAQRRLIAHRFNFSHSGMTDRLDTFERPDLFERDTWGKQAHDLRVVARAARRGEIPGPAGLPQVWFGHSRGGVTCILTAGGAYADPPRADVLPAGVVTAAAPHTGDRLSDDDKATLRKHGRIESPSSRTGQTLYVGLDWLTELEADPARHNPMRQIDGIACPVLLIHGDNDGTVNQMSAKLLRSASRDRAELRIIEGATHTFNAPNPLPPDAPLPPQTEALIDAVVSFALRCCRDGQRD